MKRILPIMGICLLTACGGQGLSGVNINNAVGAAADLGKAATLSDDEVKASAKQMRLYEEKTKEKVAPASSKYAKRLAKLTSRFRNYDGMTLNFKVYQSKEINANASADGSVRVYTGLMDIMTDDEMRFIIGHEMGHVKLGHTAAAMKRALALSGVRKGVAATGTVAGDIAASEMGGLLEAVLNAQFDQSQETASDDYGLECMRKMKGNLKAAASSLRKLASLGGSHSILSSHPDPSERASRMDERAK